MGTLFSLCSHFLRSEQEAFNCISDAGYRIYCHIPQFSQTDFQALSGDWLKIGQDFNTAQKKLMEELAKTNPHIADKLAQLEHDQDTL